MYSISEAIFGNQSATNYLLEILIRKRFCFKLTSAEFIPGGSFMMVLKEILRKC